MIPNLEQHTKTYCTKIDVQVEFFAPLSFGYYPSLFIYNSTFPFYPLSKASCFSVILSMLDPTLGLSSQTTGRPSHSVVFTGSPWYFDLLVLSHCLAKVSESFPQESLALLVS